MQNKGAIRLFAIILGLVCLYQLAFTFVTRGVESDAKEFANGDAVKERQYLDSIKNEKVYNLLVKNFTYAECKERELKLGLDLQGGMNITLEVQSQDILKVMSGNSKDPDFNKALARTAELQKTSTEDYVTLFGRAWDEVAPGKKLASPAIFGNADNKGIIDPYKSTNADVLKAIRTETDGAIDRSFEVLRNRIDKFGVSSPNIQRIANSGRIFIELPGVKDKARVRKLLQGTANLQFWETYDNREIYAKMEQANTALKGILKGDTAVAAVEPTDTNKVDTGKTATAKPEDTTKAAVAKTTKEDTAKKTEDTAATEDAKAEQARKDNPLYAVLQVPIYQNEQGQQSLQPGSCVGYVAIKDTAKVNKYLAMPAIKSLFPNNLRFMWEAKPMKGSPNVLQLHAIKVTSLDGSPALSGDVITDAGADYEMNGTGGVVNMTMNGEGRTRWKNITEANVGKCVAVTLDGYVYTSPTINEPIPNGSSRISGNFDINEARDVANVLKAGKMPAPARIVSDVVVGPSLGEEAIESGFLSFLIALALVLLFMGFYYSTAGWVADLALFCNLFFLMGVITSVGGVLTLPGIAGIVLTVGMSVDANVLIYERVREELRAGKNLRSAISDGFKMAYSSIIDANVTTLISGIVLWIFGTGPIQGFATTLVLGILTSMFSAIFITRLVFEWFLERDKKITFSIPATENLFRNVNVNWIKNRRLYYMFSGAIIIAGALSLATRGLNLGVDFKGGRTYVVRFDNTVSTEDVAKVLTPAFGNNAPEVKTFGGDNQVLIKTVYRVEDQSPEASTDVETALTDALTKGLAGNKFSIEQSQTISPTVSTAIKQGALVAFLLAVAGIFLYVVFRFRSWQYGLGAVIALMHDSFIVLGIFSIFYGILPFNLEVGQDFIAAILTIIGYSINDTVVVFDRIRENVTEHKKLPLETNINNALNQTLSRTINTSLTIFFVLFAIFVFGGEVIRGFSFALLLGIVIGTYSSICIATPIVIDFRRKKADTKA